MTTHPITPVSPRWLYALAVLTVLFTLPLLFLGAGVTSHGVGMVDPKGFRPPWEIVNGLIENSGFAWRLEYGHRTFGFLVGICSIALAVGCFFFDSRPWVGWLAFVALAMICAQGALGIFRVDYNALYGRTFALVHGVFAQLVFAVLVCLASVLSPSVAEEADEPVSPSVRNWSMAVALLVFLQLILGGLVRHREDLLGPRGHLLGAFLVVGAVVWLLKVMRETGDGDRFTVQRISLMAFLTLQIWLGIESWLARFYTPYADLPQLAPLPMHAEWIRTAHYLIGTLIFATSVSVVLIAHRSLAVDTNAEAMPSAKLEGLA